MRNETYAIFEPSGDHAGKSCTVVVNVRRRMLMPLRFAAKRSCTGLPVPSSVIDTAKAMRNPSGDAVGAREALPAFVRKGGAEVATGSVKISCEPDMKREHNRSQPVLAPVAIVPACGHWPPRRSWSRSRHRCAILSAFQRVHLPRLSSRELQVCHVGCRDGFNQYQAVQVVDAVEQTLSVAKQHGHNVKVHLINQTRSQVLLRRLRAA